MQSWRLGRVGKLGKLSHAMLTQADPAAALLDIVVGDLPCVLII
jgi:hypothetical protein